MMLDNGIFLFILIILTCSIKQTFVRIIDVICNQASSHRLCSAVSTRNSLWFYKINESSSFSVARCVYREPAAVTVIIVDGGLLRITVCSKNSHII